MHVCPVCNEIPECDRIEGDHHHSLEFRIPGVIAEESYIVVQDKVYGKVQDAIAGTARIFNLHPVKAADYIRNLQSYSTKRV